MTRLLIVAILLARQASAQSGGFVTTLGIDTVAVEQFTQDAKRWSGTIVQRTPTLRVIRWTMELDEAGRPARYTARASDAAGADILNGASGTMTFAGDSVVRDAYLSGQPVTARIGAPVWTLPGPTIPYIGVSNLMYEAGFRAARARTSATDTSVSFLSMAGGQVRPNRTRAWLIAPDSAELDYFGVARSGYKFDDRGRLIRSDWRGTTYMYRIERVPSIDADAIAAAWTSAEKAGRTFGVLSPRDSVIGMVGTARLTADYSRPAKRGRQVWGTVAPMDRVWRLGADMATHFTTDSDIEVGGTLVPAGRYTLWMIPSRTTPLLVVSKAVNVFGTNYDPAKDLARIPMKHEVVGRMAERLTLAVDGGVLAVEWDNERWSVPVRLAKRNP